jgi:hypothetical protein
MGGGVVKGPRSCCGVVPAQNTSHETAKFRDPEPSQRLLPRLHKLFQMSPLLPYRLVGFIKYLPLRGSFDLFKDTGARRQRGRISSPGKVKNFLFSRSSRPILGPTQSPIQWVPGRFFSGVKAAGSLR